MSQAMTEPKAAKPRAKRAGASAGRAPSAQERDVLASIDRALARVKARNEELSADIKDLLKRVG